MRRKLFNLAAAVSLVLSMTVASFWIRCYDHYDQVGIDLYGAYFTLSSYKGQVWAERDRWIYKPAGPERKLSAFADSRQASGMEPYQKVFGFGVYRYVNGDNNWDPSIITTIGAIVPSWFLVALFLMLPVLWRARQYRLAALVKRGACTKCGYNLTGNTSGVCPECGSPIEGKAENKRRRRADGRGSAAPIEG